LAPVTSVRPDDWTWIAARWITRWNAAVGTASDPSTSVTSVDRSSSMNSSRDCAQLVQIDRTGAHHARGVGFVDQSEKQMFQRGKFVPARIGKGQSRMDGLLKGCRKRRHVDVLL
jgi:hypothetical protein